MENYMSNNRYQPKFNERNILWEAAKHGFLIQQQPRCLILNDSAPRALLSC